MLASCDCAQVTVSMLSAIISRVCREKRIPVAISQWSGGREIGARDTLRALRDAIRDADGVELPCQHAMLLQRTLDGLAQIKHCVEPWVSAEILHIRRVHAAAESLGVVGLQCMLWQS